MNPSAAAPPPSAPADRDLADQANPGHGRFHWRHGGQPVVLIHDWPLSAQAREPQVSALQALGYRMVAHDGRGFGRSDKPDSGSGYDMLADDLQRVMDKCGLQGVTLVGFSMGGGAVRHTV